MLLRLLVEMSMAFIITLGVANTVQQQVHNLPNFVKGTLAIPNLHDFHEPVLRQGPNYTLVLIPIGSRIVFVDSDCCCYGAAFALLHDLEIQEGGGDDDCTLKV